MACNISASHFDYKVNFGFYNEEEIINGAPSDFWSSAAPGIPVFLQELDQGFHGEEPDPTDPPVLKQI